jgi:hypothetical protein
MKKSVEFSVTYNDKWLTIRLYLPFVNASFFIPTNVINYVVSVSNGLVIGPSRSGFFFLGHLSHQCFCGEHETRIEAAFWSA